MRRSGVSREQRQLILTHVGAENLDVDKVQKAMNFILGQDSKPDGKFPYRRDNVYNVGEPYVDEDEDAYWDDLAYYAEQDYEDTFWADGDDYAEIGADDDYSEVYDVEEDDEIYAAYADAKAKMNQMRVSRGFYPVVAVVERQYTPGKGKSQSSSPKKGKSKKRKDETRTSYPQWESQGKHLEGTRNGSYWPTDVPAMWPIGPLGEELPYWR